MGKPNFTFVWEYLLKWTKSILLFGVFTDGALYCVGHKSTYSSLPDDYNWYVLKSNWKKRNESVSSNWNDCFISCFGTSVFFSDYSFFNFVKKKYFSDLIYPVSGLINVLNKNHLSLCFGEYFICSKTDVLIEMLSFLPEAFFSFFEKLITFMIFS